MISRSSAVAGSVRPHRAIPASADLPHWAGGGTTAGTYGLLRRIVALYKHSLTCLNRGPDERGDSGYMLGQASHELHAAPVAVTRAWRCSRGKGAVMPVAG